MRSQFVSFYLTGAEYTELRRWAIAEEREPLQQARWILRQSLSKEQPMSASSNYYQDGRIGRSRETGHGIQSYTVTPALGTATAVLAATASAAASTVVVSVKPDAPRNVTATPGGTAANVLAVSVVITGTDINGTTITETLPAFTAGALTASVGVKAFRTVRSIAIPIVGAATTVAVGTGAKLGLPAPLSRNTILGATLGGVKEVTAPTLNPHATDPAQTTVVLASALNGTAVIIDYYEG